MRGELQGWINGASADLETAKTALENHNSHGSLSLWARVYGPKLIEAVQVLNEAFDATAQVIHEGSASAMAREARARQAVAEFLRGVGRG